MAFTDYLMVAPWWHWACVILIAALLSRWRPFKIERTTHEHKHIHNVKEE